MNKLLLQPGFSLHIVLPLPLCPKNWSFPCLHENWGDLHNLWRESLIMKLKIFINTWTLVCFSSDIHFVCLETTLLKLLVKWALSHFLCLFFYKEQNAQWLSVYGAHIYCYCDNIHSISGSHPVVNNYEGIFS